MVNEIRHIRPERWLTIFIVIHVITWTLAPTFVRLNLPMDAIEGAIWGQQFEWGYDKNPFLNGWLTQIATLLGHHHDWIIYFFCQLSVALCFWATWQLGKKILPPLYALIAVLLMEGMQYYNLHAIDFNDNTLELSLWALTILFFYQAIREKKSLSWLLTGLFAGLGMMAKYYTAILLFPMALFLLLQPQARQQLKSPYFYLGLLVFFAVITPHIIWLCSHQFVTVSYAINRVSSLPSLLNHFIFPLNFAWQQFEVFIPSLLLFFILLIGRRPIFTKTPVAISSFDKAFLFATGIAPLLITLLISAAAGITLRAAWGQPLLSLSGVILMAWLQPNITRQRFYQFIAVVYVLLAALAAGYTIALTKPSSPSSANFPGQEIAAKLTQEWQKEYRTPLVYVAGPRWLAGNIAFYSPERPKVYMDWDPRVSPWIDEKKLLQHGAIFVWDPRESVQISEKDIRARFANLGPTYTMYFPWLRSKNMEPIKIRAAFLPPVHPEEARSAVSKG